MSAHTTIAFVVQRIGPYHDARLAALSAGRKGAVHAIEFRPEESIYAWETVRQSAGYSRRSAASGSDLLAALDLLRPGTVVCVGYSDPEIHRVVLWAIANEVSLVVCSDSTYDDEMRRWPKEAIKRRILTAFDAALVAGKRAQRYLEILGVGSDRIFHPWDVVDNDHFEGGAEIARAAEAQTRTRLGVKGPFFLCVARFVPKKNLAGLLVSYADYCAIAGEEAWPLLLSGDGILREQLSALALRLGLASRVRFLGVVAYADLPAYYGLAGAVVLPSKSEQWGLVVNEAMAAGAPVVVSSRCGCSPELVKDGQTGSSFEPDVPGALRDSLCAIAALPLEKRMSMGRRSREVVAGFTPDAFARGLEAAISHALSHPRRRAPWATRVVLQMMAKRTVEVSQ